MHNLIRSPFSSAHARARSGFTIVEATIVVIVVAVLAGLITGSYSQIQKQSRDTKRKADIVSLLSELEVYYEKNGEYPINFATVNDFAGIKTTTALNNILPKIPEEFGEPRRTANSDLLVNVMLPASELSSYIYFGGAHLPSSGGTASFAIHNGSGPSNAYGCTATVNTADGTNSAAIVGYFSEAEKKPVFYWTKYGKKPTLQACTNMSPSDVQPS